MKKAGIYEAKTRLSELIRDVRRGEEVTILDRGKPVARLVPLEKPTHTDAVTRFRNLRAEARTVTQAEVREWISAGRK